MMPLAPTPIMPVPTKPKIGFTIESLVGNGGNLSIDNSPPSSHDSRPSSSGSSCGGGGDSNHRMPSPFSLMRNCRDEKRPRSESPPSISSHHNHHHHHHNHHNRHGSSSTAAAAAASSSAASRERSNNVRSVSPPSVSPVNSPSAQFSCPQQQSTIHVPTASMPPNPFLDTLSSLKGIYAPEPTYTNGMLPNLMGPHHQSMSCSPMGHVPQHSMFPGLSPLFLGNIGTVGPHQLHREAYPLYPWLLSRQGRFLGHRFQGPDAPAFLLQPFRKPKRIRTAFSPSQLLKLEHAFEKNHYVVGAERKHLAQALSLTETQVKVWFQNRRTKHKRLKQEEEQTQSSPPSPKKKGTHHLNKWKMETNQSGDENSSEAS